MADDDHGVRVAGSGAECVAAALQPEDRVIDRRPSSTSGMSNSALCFAVSRADQESSQCVAALVSRAAWLGVAAGVAAVWAGDAAHAVPASASAETAI